MPTADGDGDEKLHQGLQGGISGLLGSCARRGERTFRMGMKRCPECEGVGEMEYEKWSYRSFQDDVGGFESDWQLCQNCDGAGEIEEDDE
jgi:DnaJ-class molecular chaperone